MNIREKIKQLEQTQPTLSFLNQCADKNKHHYQVKDKYDDDEYFIEGYDSWMRDENYTINGFTNE